MTTTNSMFNYDRSTGWYTSELTSGDSVVILGVSTMNEVANISSGEDKWLVVDDRGCVKTFVSKEKAVSYARNQVHINDKRVLVVAEAKSVVRTENP